VLALVSATGLQIFADYRQTLAQQETSMRDMTHVVKLHINDTLRLSHEALQQMERLVRSESNFPNIQMNSLERMASLCNALNGCVVISIINPAGIVVARSTNDTTPGVDVSDRAYFKHAMNKGGLFVAPAVATRLRGNPILFAISKPVIDASGKVIAVVASHLSTNHFTDFYGLMGFNLDPTVAIFKRDASLVARHPDMAKHVGKVNSDSPLFTRYLPSAASGVYRSTSAFDGKVRISAYQHLPELDLVIVCGTEVDTAMASWKKRSLWTAGTGALGLVLIFIVLFWGYRSLTQQQGLLVQNSELGRLSHIDPLTGIANRRMLDAALVQEWHAHLSRNKNLSLLLIDIDSFKPYNDHYGHLEGDRCLRQIATALQAALLRKEDMVARYGGEEFVALLNSDEEGARDVAQRMRNAVQSLQIPHSFSSVAKIVTVSIGLANVSTCSAKTSEELLRCADAALYRAKAEGRNRVVLYTIDLLSSLDKTL
jgi:diguanylate cyclase (GGDEF)-like protein